MESPLRYYYLVELNLENQKAKSFPFVTMFGGTHLSYSMISSTFFKTQKECIAAVEKLAESQYKSLSDKDPEAVLGSLSAFNTQFAKSIQPYEDDETGMVFQPDEIYRAIIFDILEDEPIITITMQVSDLGTDETMHFSGETH